MIRNNDEKVCLVPIMSIITLSDDILPDSVLSESFKLYRFKHFALFSVQTCIIDGTYVQAMLGI